MDIILHPKNYTGTGEILTCPCCKQKFALSSKEMNNKYKHGISPIFCSYRCELKFSKG